MTGRWLERNEVSGPQQEPPGARHPRHGITASAGTTGSRHMGGCRTTWSAHLRWRAPRPRQPRRSAA